MKKHDFDVFFETVISKCIEDLETYSKTQFPNKDVFSKKKNMRKSIFHNYTVIAREEQVSCIQ